MRDSMTSTDILRAATELAVADIAQTQSPNIKRSIFQACEALLEAGLIPIETAPDVWRCCEQNQANTVEALRAYIDRQ